MVQATHASSPALSIEQAAAAIVRLINDRAVSPTAEEITAIISKAAGSPAAGGFALSIGGAAQEIERLWQAKDELEVGKDETDRFPYQLSAIETQRSALEALLLGLEPSNLDDVLSLLLALADAFEAFASEHSTRDQSVAAEEANGVIDRAFEAAFRGLIKAGAQSPMLDVYFGPAHRAPAADQLAKALERAAENVAARGPQAADDTQDTA